MHIYLAVLLVADSATRSIARVGWGEDHVVATTPWRRGMCMRGRTFAEKEAGLAVPDDHEVRR